MSEITITVSGPVGCGKSAIAGEIEIAMKAIGVPVRMADEAADRSEKNMTGADWTGYLEMYKPSVVIVESLTVGAAAKIVEYAAKQKALVETLTKALKTLARDVREYPEWKRHLDALGLADDAIDAAKEISA